ncbi:hypothetical protein D3C72_1216800 [compost metagenome]
MRSAAPQEFQCLQTTQGIHEVVRQDFVRLHLTFGLFSRGESDEDHEDDQDRHRHGQYNPRGRIQGVDKAKNQHRGEPAGQHTRQQQFDVGAKFSDSLKHQGYEIARTFLTGIPWSQQEELAHQLAAHPGACDLGEFCSNRLLEVYSDLTHGKSAQEQHGCSVLLLQRFSCEQGGDGLCQPFGLQDNR